MIETTLSANDCDAMVVAPLQAETVATQIANTDLPIVAIDTAIDSDKVLSFVGFNNEELAAMGGKAAVEAAKDKAGIRLPPSASWVCRATPPRRHALQALSRALQKLAASISLRKRSTQTA